MRLISSPRWNPALASAAIALTLVTVGCGSDGSKQVSSLSPTPADPSVAEPMVGCTYDYQPMRGPRAIARHSDLVVSGTIGSPRPGLTAVRKDGSRGRVETDIIPIEVSSVLKSGERLGVGSPDPPAPTVVEVEIGCAFSPPNREAKLASLEGRQAVAYLVKGPADGAKGYPGRVRYQDGAPRPRYQEASPEGFLLELASGIGVRNLSLGERFLGAQLADFYPEQREFPPKRIP